MRETLLLAQVVFGVGLVLIAAVFLKSGLRKLRLPSLVGFLLMGFLIRLADSRFDFLTVEAEEIARFLAQLGVIALLFRIGLDSKIQGLISQLRRAGPLWILNLVVSGLAGFAFSRYLLDFGFTPSIFAGVALSVTSVGVPVSVWREAGALDTPDGELLVDAAELDDISGVILMALLFSAAGIVKEGGDGLAAALLKDAGWVFLKLGLFGGGCLLFSQYVEKHFTQLGKSVLPSPDPMLMVLAVGMVTAALAGIIGFSLAIGAFFGGLMFSRDPEALRMETPFEVVHDLFVPFFFIHIGMQLDPGSIADGAGLGLVLFVAAVTGKMLGAFGPAVIGSNWRNALTVSVSLVPRAEIALIIASRGRTMGGWAVPDSLFSAIVVVSALTCLTAPMALRLMLNKWPPENRE